MIFQHQALLLFIHWMISVINDYFKSHQLIPIMVTVLLLLGTCSCMSWLFCTFCTHFIAAVECFREKHGPIWAGFVVTCITLHMKTYLSWCYRFISFNAKKTVASFPVGLVVTAMKYTITNTIDFDLVVDREIIDFLTMFCFHFDHFSKQKSGLFLLKLEITSQVLMFCIK